MSSHSCLNWTCLNFRLICDTIMAADVHVILNFYDWHTIIGWTESVVCFCPPHLSLHIFMIKFRNWNHRKNREIHIACLYAWCFEIKISECENISKPCNVCKLHLGYNKPNAWCFKTYRCSSWEWGGRKTDHPLVHLCIDCAWDGCQYLKKSSHSYFNNPVHTFF